MTVKEAAEWLKVHPNTLRRWNQLGLLKAYRIGPRGDRRFERSDIERMLSQYGTNLIGDPADAEE